MTEIYHVAANGGDYEAFVPSLEEVRVALGDPNLFDIRISLVKIDGIIHRGLACRVLNGEDFVVEVKDITNAVKVVT